VRTVIGSRQGAGSVRNATAAGPRRAAGSRADVDLRGRAGLVFAALGLVGVLLLAIFPAQAYRDQRAQRAALASRTAELSTENQTLDAKADHLGTDAELERLAREYNLVKPGEEVYFVVPRADPPSTTPPPPPPAPRSRSLWDRITSIF